MGDALSPSMNNTIDLTLLESVTGGLNTTFTPTKAQINAEVAADQKYGYKKPLEPIVKNWFDAPQPSTRF
jgi:hypothetical protein